MLLYPPEQIRPGILASLQLFDALPADGCEGSSLGGREVGKDSTHGSIRRGQLEGARVGPPSTSRKHQRCELARSQVFTPIWHVNLWAIQSDLISLLSLIFYIIKE